jgi:hypothetical protein
MDKELTEIRARMEELAFQMQQDAKSRWVYEWPMKTKVKWPVKELLARRQWRVLKEWLRYVEDLRVEEEVVHVCEPEAGRNLSDDEEKRSLEDLRDCQAGSEEFSIFQEIRRGHRMISKTARRAEQKIQVARRAMR